MLSKPFWSIISPTLQRESLITTCRSIDRQTFTSWQHVVALDCSPEDINQPLIDQLQHPQREFFCCGQRFNNFGNTPRHMAWEKATGIWQLIVDDDNTIKDNRILETVAKALETAGRPDWAVFPIYRHGQIFFNDPPGLCQSDTANIVVKREIGRWPDGPEYTMDGIWIEALKVSHPNYKTFPNHRPIVSMPYSSEGK